MGNMTCRNTDTTSGHTCAGSSPSGATMTYDAQGRLSAWTAPSGTSVNEYLLYDNEGNLVLTGTVTPNGNTSTIDFGVTETVLTSSTTSTADYYFVNGQRVAEQVGSTFSYLIPNLEGSPTVALSSTGTVSAVELFLPYGVQGFAWGTMPTPHNYTDQLLDSVMGLLYYGARWYDPLADQFTSADSVQGNLSGVNPYGYVGGNPETDVDPDGHDDLPWWYIPYLIANAPGFFLTYVLGPLQQGMGLQQGSTIQYGQMDNSSGPDDIGNGRATDTIDRGDGTPTDDDNSSSSTKDSPIRKYNKNSIRQQPPGKYNTPPPGAVKNPIRGTRGSSGYRSYVRLEQEFKFQEALWNAPAYVPPAQSQSQSQSSSSGQPWIPPVFSPNPQPQQFLPSYQFFQSVGQTLQGWWSDFTSPSPVSQPCACGPDNAPDSSEESPDNGGDWWDLFDW